MKKISLTQLSTGRGGKVCEITGSAGLKDKLMGMGIYQGKEIKKVSQIGLQGPAVIRVNRSLLALGHSVAIRIMVETA